MNGWQYTAFSEQEREQVGQRWDKQYAAWQWLVDPVFWGHEHVNPAQPSLWVGNHSLLAFADGSLMMRELFVRHNIVLRSLALHDHFKVPVWGRFLVMNGAVDGTRENCTAMMQAKEQILVYPGGGGEVMKRQGEQHQLRWKNRTGFARMAIENNYPIQPFATVGADDCWDILYDNNQWRETRIGRWLLEHSHVKAEELPPLIKGLGPTLLPKPQRMYFRFFPAIYPDEFKHLPIEAGALALRQKVESIVQNGINELLAYREQDPLRSLRARLLAKGESQFNRSLATLKV